MTDPNDSRFASLGRRTYLRLQAAGLLTTGAAGVGRADSHEPTGYGDGGFGEAGFGGVAPDAASDAEQPTSQYSSTRSEPENRRLSSTTSAEYELDSDNDT